MKSTRRTNYIGKYIRSVQFSCSLMSDSLQRHGLQPTRPLCPWDFPGKSTGVGCHFLLQGIFPTQGLNPGLPHCRQMLYCLSHQGGSHFYIFIIIIFSDQMIIPWVIFLIIHILWNVQVVLKFNDCGSVILFIHFRGISLRLASFRQSYT